VKLGSVIEPFVRIEKVKNVSQQSLPIIFGFSGNQTMKNVPDHNPTNNAA